MKIATWNVNSLRVRLPHVLDWLQNHSVDALCIQETKTVDEQFPLEAINEAGYQALYAGQKTYNGVALLSREPATDWVTDLPGLDDPQRRVLGATLGEIRILNLYVPNGSEVGSDKYEYKLNWFKHLNQFVSDQLKRYPKMIVAGDFNIAPADLDVHDPDRWKDKIICSTAERELFNQLLDLGFIDSFRKLNPEANEYSWWDYRAQMFRRNLGLRIDHILASDPLMQSCTSSTIDKAPRALERPSDHAPVIAEFSE